MRILFITSNRIGDAILSTGLLDHLLQSAPGARVTVAAGPAAAPLFAATPGVERVIALAKRRLAGHWLGLWWYGVRRLWDLVVDLRGSALGWFLPARRQLVLRPDDRLHRVVHLAGLVGRAGDPPAPHVHTGPEHRAVAERLIPGDRPVLAVGPTANWGGKQWPIERFVSMVATVTGPEGILPGARVAVFGAASERPMAAPLLDGLPPERSIDLVGKVDLLTAAACLERCALYVGNDSGLMHLAAATGIPTLGLFGPSRETLYGPWGVQAASVRTDLGYDEILATPGYDYRKSDTQMGTLTVEKALAALEALWHAKGPA
jgi:ADP-heptose:LPS heptosyltransferase